MNTPYQRGPKGVRGDRYSGSKVTNSTQFQPFYSVTEKIYSKFYQEFQNRTWPLIRIAPTHEDFIFPVTEKDIEATLARIPPEYVAGVKAILVPGGSKKQIKVAKSLYLFGEYWQECVFLHPYPKARLTLTFYKKPNPSVTQEYRRAGAIIKTKRSGIEISFDETSLKQFYLRDVLMHEIGHHNDNRLKDRSRRKSETFAEWFALEHGFRLWGETMK